MTTIACPHRAFGYRACPGCTAHGADDLPGLVCCASDGEITATVIQDSDGDASIPYGLRHFSVVEDEQASCGCNLSKEEWDAVREQMVDGYGDDLASDLEDEARREVYR